MIKSPQKDHIYSVSTENQTKTPSFGLSFLLHRIQFIVICFLSKPVSVNMTLREISYTRVHSGNDIERARARNEINTEKDKEGEENRGKNNELTGVHFFFFFTLLFTT